MASYPSGMARTWRVPKTFVVVLLFGLT